MDVIERNSGQSTDEYSILSNRPIDDSNDCAGLLPRSRYLSLYELFNYEAGNPRQSYNGNLEFLLESLKKAVETRSDASLNALVLHPPRIIRAVIDYKIDHHGYRKGGDLVNSAIEIGLGIYCNPAKTLDYIKRFRQTLDEFNNPEILRREVVQLEDYMSWQASAPELSAETASSLAQSTDHAPLLFIALGHGSVGCGMDVFLRYCDLTSSDSRFYVARYSVRKHKDLYPQLTLEEIDNLNSLAERRIVVIFDEDTCTGTTLMTALKHFRQLFGGKDIVGIANLDKREDLVNMGIIDKSY